MPMLYRDFDIEAFNYEEGADGERFSVRVANSPAGQQRLSQAEQVTLSTGLRKRLRQLESRSLGLRETIEVGEQLADLLLPQGPRWFLDRSRVMLRPAEGLRIRIRLDSYALSDLPWEYLYIPGPDTPPDQRGPKGFLALDRLVSLVRYEAMGQPVVSLDPVGSGPLRLVTMLANPNKPPKYPGLDLEAEQANIEKAMREVPEIEAQFFPGGRIADLEDALKTGAHMLHFAGHGDFLGEMGAKFGTQEGKGALVLIGEDGRPQLFPVETLAQNLVGRNIRLAVFGACRTAQRDRYNAWTGVAPALSLSGVPAVVAMQYAIRDTNAVAFSREFYETLASGETIDAAVTDGRLAIFNRSDLDGVPYERDWGVPVLYLRTSGGALFPKAEPGPTRAVDRRALRDLMISAFNIEGLEALCWDAAALLEEAGIKLKEPISLEMVGGGSKTAIVMNLIDYFETRGYLDYLVQGVRNARPGRI
jgi:hypothetical protein